MRYDDYTEDIEENRLVKAAHPSAHRLPPGVSRLRRRLAEMQAALSLVSDVTLLQQRTTALHLHATQRALPRPSWSSPPSSSEIWWSSSNRERDV